MTNSKVNGCGAIRRAAAAVSLLVSAWGAQAAPVIYDLEGLASLTSVTTQVSGLTFANTIALVAGISLNELDFPPHSGTTVVSDDGGAIVIDLGTLATGIGAFFTYTEALSFEAFDAGNVSLGVVTSAFASNFGSGNEFISFGDVQGRIARLVVTGNPAGGSFTLDDLTVDYAASVPEPATLALVLGALALAVWSGRPMRHGWTP